MFASFQKHDVKYVVIGGIAAILHGVPRVTFGLDLLIEATTDNAARLLAALLESRFGTAALTTPEEVLANAITIFNLQEITTTLTRRDMDQLVQTLRGLTRTEAERVVASVICQDFALSGDDLPAVLDAKRSLLGSAGSLDRHPIFLVATANDISALPPELMRKGRFDEVFFVDLPTSESRMNILSIHLLRRERDPAHFDLVQLAEASEGFNGAELEHAILGAMYGAFQEGCQLEDRHILDEMSKTRPLSVLMAERITELREWARDRCVSAD